jgi:hypothetical protein
VGSGPFLARRAAARSTNLGFGELSRLAGAEADGVSGLSICCLRSRILVRTAVARSSRVGVWVLRPTVGASVAAGSDRGIRLDESGARAQAEQAREGWRWTEKVVLPRRRVLQPVKPSTAGFEMQAGGTRCSLFVR